MKRLAIVFTLCLTACLVGAATVPDGQPRAVRLLAWQVAPDSLAVRLQWVAPQRTGGQTPIVGYEWELWVSTGAGAPWTARLRTGTVPEDGTRRVDVVVPHHCTADTIYYTARIRATGNFSGVAEWGSSASLPVPCLDDTPPGPPVVDIDTIPRDTITGPADSTVFRAVELRDAVWDDATGDLRITALGGSARVCAFAYRDGSAALVPRASWVATHDSTTVRTTSNVLTIIDADPPESACWWWTAHAAGQAAVHLCSTDCGPTMAVVPGWLRWPLLLTGIALWVFAPFVDRQVATLKGRLRP